MVRAFLFVVAALAAVGVAAPIKHKDPAKVFESDLIKISEQAGTFNIAIKGLPGPRALSKKIAVGRVRMRPQRYTH